jgi:hypothetical protein
MNFGMKDSFVKNCHSEETRSQSFCNCLNRIDFGFRQNDKKWCFLIFCEFIIRKEKVSQKRRNSKRRGAFITGGV